MADRKTGITMGAVETRFAGIIWDREPVPSGDLIAICRDELGWNKSTTYTVLRRLIEKGIFKNEDGVVTSVMTRDEYLGRRSGDFIEETFAGSLPAFIAAFSRTRTLTAEEAESIKRMIDEKTGGGKK